MPRRSKDENVNRIERRIEEHVAERIRLRRSLMGISQTDAAERLGVTFQQFQKYEKASNRVSVAKLYRMTAVLDVPLPFFFEGLERAAAPDELTPNAADTLCRRDFAVLRAWRLLPREVADALERLLNAASGGSLDLEGDAIATGSEGSEIPERAERVGETVQNRNPRRRRRGAVWDLADIG